MYFLIGLNKFCQDMKFMLGIDLGFYWRFCWGFFIPVGLSVILVYSLLDFNLPTFKNMPFPHVYYGRFWLKMINVNLYT